MPSHVVQVKFHSCIPKTKLCVKVLKEYKLMMKFICEQMQTYTDIYEQKDRQKDRHAVK